MTTNFEFISGETGGDSSSEAEPEPESGGMLSVGVDISGIHEYRDEPLINEYLSRLVVAHDSINTYRIFFIKDTSPDNPGEVHMDVNGHKLGRLSDSDVAKLAAALKNAKPIGFQNVGDWHRPLV